jgi:adenylyltransferase/sulfurtransferase
MHEDSAMQRYSRQIRLEGFGFEGQRRLLQSAVLVVGAGGLGCAALAYLAGAGVGRIGTVDPDMVSLENLHRQVLFDMGDIGVRKTAAAARRLKALNPDIDVIEYPLRLSNAGCLELFPQYDVILDCTDNFPTRFMVNDACVLLGRPLVSAAVSRYEGQLGVFNLTGSEGERPVHYRDLLPEPPPEGTVANCSEEGVLGVLPGMMGSLQAAEAIKILTGIGTTLAGRLLCYDMRENRFFEASVSKAPAGTYRMPTDSSSFLAEDYSGGCISADAHWREIGPEEMEALVVRGDTLVVDVRETHEQLGFPDLEHLRIPLSVIDGESHTLTASRIILVCQGGTRSRQAARKLSESVPTRELFSLRGGVIAWREYKKSRHG